MNSTAGVLIDAGASEGCNESLPEAARRRKTRDGIARTGRTNQVHAEHIMLLEATAQFLRETLVFRSKPFLRRLHACRFLQLDKRDIQFPPATQRVTSLSHFGQAANSMCFELPPTSPTALYPLAKINLQDCILEWGGLCERFKREGNRLRINARKFADAQAHFDDAQAAVPCGLFRGPLQNGLRSSIAL